MDAIEIKRVARHAIITRDTLEINQEEMKLQIGNNALWT